MSRISRSIRCGLNGFRTSPVWTVTAASRSNCIDPSVHPVGEGQLACTDCHNPHGGPGPADLHTFTANELVLWLSRRKARAFPVGTPAGSRGLRPLPRTARFGPSGSADPAARPFLLSTMPYGAISSFDLVERQTGLPGESLPSGSQSLLGRDCNELSCPGAWFEPPVWRRTNTLDGFQTGRMSI